MIPLLMILRESKRADTLNGEKINHLIFMGHVKLFVSLERGPELSFHTVVSTDIGMQFGISNCTMLVIWGGKVTKTVGIRMPDDREIKNLEKGKSYKHLGGTVKRSNVV